MLKRFNPLKIQNPKFKKNTGLVLLSLLSAPEIGCLHGDFRPLRDQPRVDPSVYMVIIGSTQVFESI